MCVAQLPVAVHRSIREATQEVVLKHKTLYRWTLLIYNPSQVKDVLQYLDKNNKGGPKIRDTLYFESF